MNQEISPQHILLIDDNPDDRLLAMRELQQEFPSAQLQQVANATEFAQVFAIQSFDLVVTDYELNWSTGLDILQQVKTRDPNLPVIMFTNSGTQEVAVAAMKAGLDDYVIKSPKHRVRLSQAARSAWEKAQNRRRINQLELRLHSLLSELDIGVFRMTSGGELLEVNQGFLQLLGLRSFEEAQQFFQSQLAHHTLDPSQFDHSELQVQVNCPNPSITWIQINQTLTQSGSVLVINGVIHDITAEKQAEVAVRQMNLTLEQRIQERTAQLTAVNKELEAFAFSVSHDLRTPIRQIDGFVMLLRQHLEAQGIDETVQHYLWQISSLVTDANQLIDDLLEFSRTGRAEMHYSRIDMNHLVQTVRQQIDDQFSDRAIQWTIQSLPEVDGDRTLLQRVWQNLLSNAVKYTQMRPVAIITVGSTVNAHSVNFFVQDNGIGFDMRYVDRLFTIFQRLHHKQDFEGNGIGLANVKRIVHRHGGRVWAEARVNEGATFYFSLPKRVS